MALAEMCKVRIAVHRTAADELAAKLQSLGCCEFVKNGAEAGDGGAASSLSEKRRSIEGLISDARFVQRLLEPYETKKESSFARALGDMPALSLKRLAASVDEGKFTSFVSGLREKERQLTETRAELSRLKGLAAQAEQLAQIKYPLEFFTAGTDMITGAVYQLPSSAAGDFAARIEKDLGEISEFQRVPPQGKDGSELFAVLCRSEDFDKLQQAADELSASRTDVPKDLRLTASEEINTLSSKISELKAKEDELLKSFASLADEGLPMTRTCGDYWAILRDRLEAMETGEPTSDTLIWDFWTPASQLKKVEYTVNEYSEFTEFAVIKPGEDEVPPTLLKNPAWSSSIEPLTIMYGTPTYGGVDPTSLMAPFFFLFLGMCFGDAGYGLILTGILGYMLVKHRLSPTLRKFFVLMTVGMVVTVIFGAVTGSWFGDAVTAFPFLSKLVPAAKKIQLLDPMNDPMTLLMISLGLGFIQVMFGLAIAFCDNWKNGDKVAAISDQGGWMVFLLGLVLTGCSMTGYLPQQMAFVSKLVACAGALILVATQGREKKNIAAKLFSGVLSLYNVTGYLGDVLSYSRLLALGLGSAAVGMVINLLARLVSGTPYVGIVLAVLIFVLGHSFSIVVNLLGAFIHSLRLQYVEFFGKFYNATGHDFAPLRNSAQYSIIQEETSAN
ncbi:MAG: V-type ATP synthase subunit I [Synergistes sp.]|nr:V-type ATP synthase subunit I [Synergistes sp.]